MQIRHRLTFGFVGIALLIGATGYTALRASRAALQRAIGESSERLAAEIMNETDRFIYNRIEQLQVHGRDLMLRRALAQSNTEFDRLQDIPAFIDQAEALWNPPHPGAVTPFVAQLLYHPLAKQLRDQLAFMQKNRGHPVFGEIVVTNKYGATVALTTKSPGYYAGDEPSWQSAKTDGTYIGDVQYDESSAVYCLHVTIRIDDNSGNFLGNLEASLNIEEIQALLDEAKAASEYKTVRLTLTTHDGKTLYSTAPFDFLQDASRLLAPGFANAPGPNYTDYYIGRTESNTSALFAHAHSRGYAAYKGLGWILTVQYDTHEVFAPVINLRNTVMWISLGVMTLAIAVGLLTSRSIARPITTLNKAVVEIGKGNLDAPTEFGANDEIGALGVSFRKMAGDLKKTLADLNNEIGLHEKTEQDLRESEARLSVILDNVQTGIFIIDPQTHLIVDANPVASKLTGRPREQLVGSLCHNHICPADKGHCPITDLGQSVDSSQRVLLTAAGEHKPIIKTVVAVMLAGRKHLLESFVDLSERIKIEQDLAQVNKDLEAAVQELSRSNRQLQDFVHIAAHDLKTPLRGIGTLADWLGADYADKLDQQGREQVRLLMTRAKRIDKLIDGMLEFSKITRSRNKERPVNLNALLSRIVEQAKPAAGVEIAVDSLPTVACESAHIARVFQSLVANAVMFMNKPKGLIKVTCVEQGDFWKFSVADNGPGIQARYFDKIFKIFQTLPTKDEPETPGVGLAVARKIVELYGGQIWVESVPDSGSTFFFTFPKLQQETIYADAKTYSAC